MKIIRQNGINYINVNHPQEVYFNMLKQCNGIEWVEDAFILAWDSYELDEWFYDGATFVRENNGDFWEVASFIHDWLNVTGYVGKPIDKYFISLMIALEYSVDIIFERCKWMQWTWLNVINHKYIKKDFISRELPTKLRNK